MYNCTRGPWGDDGRGVVTVLRRLARFMVLLNLLINGYGHSQWSGGGGGGPDVSHANHSVAGPG